MQQVLRCLLRIEDKIEQSIAAHDNCEIRWRKNVKDIKSLVSNASSSQQITVSILGGKITAHFEVWWDFYSEHLRYLAKFGQWKITLREIERELV